MSKTNFEKFVAIQHTSNYLNKVFINKTVLNEVTKFHQSQLWFPHDIIYEETIDYLALLYWKNFISHNEITNELGPDYVNLSDIINKGFGMLDSVISTLAVSMNSTLCDVRSIIPLILVNSKVKEYPLKNGCYLFVGNSNKLINLREWNESDIELLNECNIYFNQHQEIAVAFAIDLRRSVLLDETRGYRKSLVDVGKISTSIEYELRNHFHNKIKADQILDFADNALTRVCGLNSRLAPLISVQHIIMEELECIID